jgi:hypothetical protein
MWSGIAIGPSALRPLPSTTTAGAPSTSGPVTMIWPIMNGCGVQL